MSVDFKAKQLEFTSYIRDPENNPAPADVKKQRMEMYRQLLFNNIDSFLSGNFPVLRKILDEQKWFELTQDFFAKHRSETPYFTEISEEFLAYLQNERDNPDDLPFMLELAHYEWVEMALSIAKEEIAILNESIDDLLKKRIFLSPLAWPLAYQYPVQKISPAFLPVEAPEQPTFLIVYRNQDEDVNFLEITPITYRLLQILQENESLLAEQCLKQVAEELNHPDPEIIIAGGLDILRELAEKSVITLQV
ncbi:MAG: putative DNA-binding domain-containing protein [Methylobacter sp.]|nr:putative DNA-binding domain-containing protein [Methylobacter sp.]